MSTATRQAFTKTYYQVEIRETELPPPGPGELLVEIAACAICGTDLSIAGKTAKEWSPIGHEVSGVVRAVGEGVRRFRVGDRVALDSSAPCGACPACRAGRPLDCTDVKSYWGKAMGFADFLVTPQQCAFHAADLTPEIACLLEPTGVGIDLAAVAEVGPGDRVLIIGPGPLGLLAIPECRRRGAGRIWVAGHSHSTARLEAALALGADKIVENDQTELTAVDFGAEGVNKLLVVAPPAMLPVAAKIGVKGSILSYIGIAWDAKGTISLDADAFHFKRQQLRASMASPGTRGPEALALLRSGLFDPRQVISSLFELPELSEAMAVNRDDKARAKKLVMRNPACVW